MRPGSTEPSNFDSTPTRNAQHSITTPTADSDSTQKSESTGCSFYESNARMVIMIENASRIDDGSIAIDPRIQTQ